MPQRRFTARVYPRVETSGAKCEAARGTCVGASEVSYRRSNGTTAQLFVVSGAKLRPLARFCRCVFPVSGTPS
eukprot:3675606-Lingulodinium_polyedra.AAC.1